MVLCVTRCARPDRPVGFAQRRIVPERCRVSPMRSSRRSNELGADQRNTCTDQRNKGLITEIRVLTTETRVLTTAISALTTEIRVLSRIRCLGGVASEPDDFLARGEEVERGVGAAVERLPPLERPCSRYSARLPATGASCANISVGAAPVGDRPSRERSGAREFAPQCSTRVHPPCSKSMSPARVRHHSGRGRHVRHARRGGAAEGFFRVHFVRTILSDGRKRK